MGWNFLAILLVVALVCSAIGFYKYVYFLSIGYGFAVAGIGITLIVMTCMGMFATPVISVIGIVVALVLFIIYGARLSGFLLVREIKNSAYQKTLKEATGDESKMPFFVKLVIWITVAVLYVGQTSPVFFRLYNGSGVTSLLWVGIGISVIGIVLESIADKQKGQQKKLRPDKVATEGLYKIVRCPNYFGEILFWTGVFVGGIDIYAGVGQWLLAVIC